METGFGSNIATSSAGAIGAFQFLPSTAKGYNYPLTNTPSARQFQQQTEAAARYLSDLHGQYGDWNTAIQHYSGGGYGLAEVKAKAAGSPDTPSAATRIKDAVTAPVNAITDAGTALGKFYEFITNIQTWIRIGEGIAGMVLIYFGLKELT